MKEDIQYNKYTFYIVEGFWLTLIIFLLFGFILDDIKNHFMINFVVMILSFGYLSTCSKKYIDSYNEYYKEKFIELLMNDD